MKNTIDIKLQKFLSNRDKICKDRAEVDKRHTVNLNDFIQSIKETIINERAFYKTVLSLSRESFTNQVNQAIVLDTYCSSSNHDEDDDEDLDEDNDDLSSSMLRFKSNRVLRHLCTLTKNVGGLNFDINGAEIEFGQNYVGITFKNSVDLTRFVVENQIVIKNDIKKILSNTRKSLQRIQDLDTLINHHPTGK